MISLHFRKIELPSPSDTRYLIVVTCVTNCLAGDTFRLDLKVTTRSSELARAERFKNTFECSMKPGFLIAIVRTRNQLKWEKKQAICAGRIFPSQ